MSTAHTQACAHCGSTVKTNRSASLQKADPAGRYCRLRCLELHQRAAAKVAA